MSSKSPRDALADDSRKEGCGKGNRPTREAILPVFVQCLKIDKWDDSSHDIHILVDIELSGFWLDVELLSWWYSCSIQPSFCMTLTALWQHFMDDFIPLEASLPVASLSRLAHTQSNTYGTPQMLLLVIAYYVYTCWM